MCYKLLRFSLIIIIPRTSSLFNGAADLLYLGMNRSITSILILLACVILSINAIRSISESYGVSSIYEERKRQTERQYLEVIKKKNELDYINSPFFVEKQLRESLNYYRSGEKLLVFTQSPLAQTETVVAATKTPLDQWGELLRFGIRDPLEQL